MRGVGGAELGPHTSPPASPPSGSHSRAPSSCNRGPSMPWTGTEASTSPSSTASWQVSECLSPYDTRTLSPPPPGRACPEGGARWDPGPPASGTDGAKPSHHLPGGDGTFVIDAASGNLTMTGSVPSPKTFLLLVKVSPLARSSRAPPEPQAAGLPLQGPAVTAAPDRRASRRTAPATR